MDDNAGHVIRALPLGVIEQKYGNAEDDKGQN
jgi:hypothetical protein